jgi:hypothetical protein
MNRTQIVGDFADSLGVKDEMFDGWRELHVKETRICKDNIIVMEDTRWNNFAIYTEFHATKVECVYRNYESRSKAAKA